MNWYIGQEIVCIKTHPKGVVKRGKIYTIKGLITSFCGCDRVKIDIGAERSQGDNVYSFCGRCSISQKNYTNAWWFSESRFAPLEYNQDAINELLEQPILIER